VSDERHFEVGDLVWLRLRPNYSASGYRPLGTVLSIERGFYRDVTPRRHSQVRRDRLHILWADDRGPQFSYEPSAALEAPDGLDE
jgi:hypothetical protein